MKLSTKDVELFYSLQFALYAYINGELTVVPTARTPQEIRDLDVEDKMKIRNAVWDNPALIDSFIEANPFDFNAEELDIIQGWQQHNIRGEFLAVSHLKSYSVFYDQSGPPYGVLALRDDFETLLGSHLPVVVEAVLLPFKGEIVYDGMISSYRITFGGGARRNINDSYQEAKIKHGIVTKLPFSPKAEKVPTDEDMLKLYLKNERNRERYSDEIWELTSKNPKMLTGYHQIMGRNHARHYGREFRKMGINGGWFAILQGLIVASGITEGDAEKAMKRIVPKEKQAWVYIFRFKQ